MNAPVESPASAAIANLARLHALQRAAFARERYPSLEVRRDRLERLLSLTREHESAIVEAIDADFGSRSPHETRLAEILIAANGIRDALRDLRRWMKPRRVATPLALLPGRGEVLPQPLGVVGIIAPWNYPFQLAIVPATGALAAGNRVLLKPSEITPRTSALMAELVAARFDEDEFAVVPGDADVGRAFAATKFDHLFFTGSTAVGRQVARAAAEQLVPVTLELGGKSPALFASDADLDLAVPRFVAGKLFNAGQTCIAPDYALVPVAMRDTFVARVRVDDRAVLSDARRQSRLHGDRERPSLRAIAAPRRRCAGARCAGDRGESGRGVAGRVASQAPAHDHYRRRRRDGGDAGRDLRAAAAGRDLRHARRRDRPHRHRAPAPWRSTTSAAMPRSAIA